MEVTTEDRKQLNKVLKGLGRRKTKKTIFYDLCFCLCAPQTTFKSNIKVIKELKESNFYEKPVDVFIGFQKEKNLLKEMLKPVRFYNNKAKYLIEAKKRFGVIYAFINSIQDGYAKRLWLVLNVKGMGMKAASHFLRNLGHDELAIIDTHIIKFMASREENISQSLREELIREYQKTAAKSGGYGLLEEVFQEIADEHKLSVAELDALVWKTYSNTDWKDFSY